MSEWLGAGHGHEHAPYLQGNKPARASRTAIRHYEALGLLPPAARKGNYRVYTERDVFLVHVIKHAQGFDFSLAELRELVAAIAEKPRFPLKLATTLIERKRAALRQQVADIRAIDRGLAQLVREMNRLYG
jgi:DNA-binding transcriptional MerR regulator